MYTRYVMLAGWALIALPLAGNRALGARSMLMSLDGYIAGPNGEPGTLEVPV